MGNYRRKSSFVGLWAALIACWLVGCSATGTTAASPNATPGAIDWAHPSHMQALDLANRYLATMSLDHKIGQMLMVQYISSNYDSDAQQITQQIQPGALVLYRYQMTSLPAAQTLIASAQHDSPIQMLVSADNEGGFIDNLSNMFPPRPSATDIGYRNDPRFAYDQGKLLAQNMLQVGLNTDLAPDVDVQTIDGPDQSTRTYGTTPTQVSLLAGQVLDGLQQNGVVGTLKHFPGLGDASTDAHLSLPVINETHAQIEAIDLGPYRALINSSDPPGMIMSTDLLMPALDDHWPAELSPTIINGVLRGELHYDGVVLTDALYMQGITKATGNYPGMSQFDAGVQAIKAGCDMLLDGYDLTSSWEMIHTIENAIQNGVLSVARINQSVQRILMLKIERGLMPRSPNPAPGVPQPQLAGFAVLPGDQA
jgi:beta-N-acetylhexosaminidase